MRTLALSQLIVAVGLGDHGARRVQAATVNTVRFDDRDHVLIERALRSLQFVIN